MKNNGEMTDLGVFGNNKTRARGITERGQIVGYSEISPTGESHAFFLN